MKCKHETEYLIGTADGIVCRKCGALFATFAELEKDTAEVKEAPEAAKEAPKRATRRGKKTT